MGKPDYASIRVPALAFAAYPVPVGEQLQDYDVRSDQDRQSLEDLYASELKYLTQSVGAFRSSVPTARVVKMFGASHYIFISNQADLLFEMRSFMSRLH